MLPKMKICSSASVVCCCLMIMFTHDIQFCQTTDLFLNFKVSTFYSSSALLLLVCLCSRMRMFFLFFLLCYSQIVDIQIGQVMFNQIVWALSRLQEVRTVIIVGNCIFFVLRYFYLTCSLRKYWFLDFKKNLGISEVHTRSIGLFFEGNLPSSRLSSSHACIKLTYQPCAGSQLELNFWMVV